MAVRTRSVGWSADQLPPRGGNGGLGAAGAERCSPAGMGAVVGRAGEGGREGTLRALEESGRDRPLEPSPLCRRCRSSRRSVNPAAPVGSPSGLLGKEHDPSQSFIPSPPCTPGAFPGACVRAVTGPNRWRQRHRSPSPVLAPRLPDPGGMERGSGRGPRLAGPQPWPRVGVARRSQKQFLWSGRTPG